ncbi:transcriptional regulator [Fibrobacteria bacterium R8-3-H12]
MALTILPSMKYGQVETGKLYFSSSEAAEQIGVSADVLHSWEKKYPELSPKKNANGKRVYKQSDIETAKEIKEKLANEGDLSVDKPARQTKTVKKTSSYNNNELLKIRNKLQNVLENIKNQK